MSYKPVAYKIVPINMVTTSEEERDKWLQAGHDVEALYPASVVEALQDDLQFVERWANHHGAKPNVTAQEALSCIQHYPSIAEITKSYEDGVIPSTRNPYAEIEALKSRVAELEAPLTHHQILSTCLSYRHDFGLMEIWQQAALFNEAKNWEACFKKERDFAASERSDKSKNGDSK